MKKSVPAPRLADPPNGDCREAEWLGKRLTTLCVATTIASAVLFYFLSTHGTWNPLYAQTGVGFDGRFFLAQAQAMAHGGLAVDPKDLEGECFVSAGHCYGYFGITPSLLRLPLLPLLGGLDNALTSVFITIALTFAAGSAMAILCRLVRRIDRPARGGGAVLIGAAITLGPASILCQLTRPAVYEEAIAWGAAFLCFSTYCFLRWWSGLQMRWLVLLALALALGANARPTVLPAAVVLGLGVAVRSWSQRDVLRRRARVAGLGAAAIAVLPIASTLGVFALKFGQPLPSLLLNQQIGGPLADASWLAIRRIDHDQLQSIRFLPTSLLTDLRPDALEFKGPFPFVTFRIPAFARVAYVALARGSLYVSRTSSLTDDMPFAVALSLFGIVRAAASGLRIRSGRLAGALGSPLPYCAVASAGAWCVTLTSVGIVNRYLGDAFPLLSLAVAFGASRLVPAVSARAQRWRILLGVVIGGTLAWSIAINLALTYQAWWR